jgi:hypothetical protein
MDMRPDVARESPGRGARAAESDSLQLGPRSPATRPPSIKSVPACGVVHCVHGVFGVSAEFMDRIMDKV